MLLHLRQVSSFGQVVTVIVLGDDSLVLDQDLVSVLVQMDVALGFPILCLINRLRGFQLPLSQVVAYRNLSLEHFEKIFVVMRNPYELELSRYSYLQKNLPQDRGRAQDIALEGDFKKYLETAPFFGMTPPRLDLYYHVNGYMPENLVILRYEHLAEGIERNLANFLTPGYELPHENESAHESVAEIYDSEMEELCYRRHRWFFDKSFYARSAF